MEPTIALKDERKLSHPLAAHPLPRASLARKLCFVWLLLHACLCMLRGVDAFNPQRLAPRSTRNRAGRPSFPLSAFKQQLGEFETLNIISPQDEHGDDSKTVAREDRMVELFDYSSLDPVPYNDMWDVQKDVMRGQMDRIAAVMKGDASDEIGCRGSQFFRPSADGGVNADDDMGHDTIIMLQHKPVYTLGTGSDPGFIKSAEEEGARSGIDIIRIERGGEVTYHGPGQLVVYPIIDLRGYRQDIHWYVRALEEAVLVALAKAGVDGAVREEDVTGIWIGGNKVAALGVKVRRWVTMHGLAINIDNRSLGNFAGIVPCGLVGRDVTCVNDHLDVPITMEQFASYMRKALEEVFEVKVVEMAEKTMISNNAFPRLLPPSRLGESHPSLPSFLKALYPNGADIQSPPQRSGRKYYSLIIVTDTSANRILLGMKHRGFGKGLYGSFGGKLDGDETPAAGAVRELFEEANIEIPEEIMERSSVGNLFFTFDDQDEFEMIVHLFRVDLVESNGTNVKQDWTERSIVTAEADLSQIRGCDEITPEWFILNSAVKNDNDSARSIPFDSMFADDSIWMPKLLSAERHIRFDGHFHFDAAVEELTCLHHVIIDKDELDL